VEEALERGAGVGRRAEVGHGRRRRAAWRLLLLLGMRWARLGRGAGRVGVAAGGHGGGDWASPRGVGRAEGCCDWITGGKRGSLGLCYGPG
jgi:hypothetical protein